MSACGQAEEEGSAEGPAPPPPRELYVPKNGGSAGKAVRILTVAAYLLSVSLAAILLSVYYVCVWSPSVLPQPLNHDDDSASPLAQRLAAPAGATAAPALRHAPFAYGNGRSDSTVGSESSSDRTTPTSYAEEISESAPYPTSEAAPAARAAAPTEMAPRNSTPDGDFDYMNDTDT